MIDPAPPNPKILAPDLLPVVREAATLLRPDELAAPMLVGVSGGPDSLALLHVLWRWALARGIRLHAIQVDHGLRPESVDEAARVVALCAAWGVPVTARRVEPGAIISAGLGIEEGARRARYRLFAQEAAALGARTLALGHQSDDQAETLLLHLLRGCGMAGLTGMPVVRRAGDLLDRFTPSEGGMRPAIWRPLLGTRRATIEAYCRQWGLVPSHDPSNDDLTLRRNVIRQRILPALAEQVPDAPAILARAAALLADDEDALTLETTRAWERCAVIDGDAIVTIDRAHFRAEHRALQRRLLRHAWRTVRGVAMAPGPSAAPIEAARAAILDGRTGGRWSLPEGVLLLVERELALLGEASSLEECLRHRLGVPLVTPGWSAAVVPGLLPLDREWAVLIARAGGRHDARHIPCGFAEGNGADARDDVPMLRTWEGGDWLRLTTGGRQKLQDWFVDRHIPRYARRHLILLAQGAQILWVAGMATFPLVGAGDSSSPRCGLTLRVLYNGAPDERAGASLTI